MSTLSPSRIISPERTSIGNILENLRADQLRISPALAHPSIRPALGDGAISNQQAIDALNAFYASHQEVVDTTTNDTTRCVQNNQTYISTMNGFSWQSQQLTTDEQTTTSSAIFGDSSQKDGGIWSATLN